VQLIKGKSRLKLSKALGSPEVLSLTAWRLVCERCGKEWLLEVSFDLLSMGRLYHYCKYCNKNSFHKVVGRVD